MTLAELLAPIADEDIELTRRLVNILNTYESMNSSPRAHKIARRTRIQLESLLARPRRIARFRRKMQTFKVQAKKALCTAAVGGIVGFGTGIGYDREAREAPTIERTIVQAPRQEAPHNTGTPILMYHNIGHEENRFTVSPDRLEAHLDWLRINNYTLQTFQQYHENPSPRGAVLTFDDSTEDQFRYRQDGSLDPASAIGVLERYKTLHPEYNVTATFFVNLVTQNEKTVFEQEGLEKRKLEFLANNGYEIGAHGAEHRDFSKMSYPELLDNLTTFLGGMREALPEYHVTSFAYPYGSLPSKGHQEVVESFFPHTAHAWGGIAAGETVNTPRIEVGPETQLAQYLPSGNAYKPLPHPAEHARSDSQLPTWQAHDDRQPDDRLRGWRADARRGHEVGG